MKDIYVAVASDFSVSLIQFHATVQIETPHNIYNGIYLLSIIKHDKFVLLTLTLTAYFSP